MHPRERIIRSMSRTLIVTSFADWLDETEPYTGQDDDDFQAECAVKDAARKAGFEATHGAYWMDTVPKMSDA